MKTIQITSCVSTDLDPAFATASTIEIEDKPFGGGAFGVAYRAIRFDGKSTSPQVIKILHDTGNGAAKHALMTVRGLQDRLRTANRNMSGKLIQTFPALQAIPQLSFEGRLDGRPVIGYSANDLTHAGFEDFADILEDPARVEGLQNLPVSAKMRIALELVSAFEFLKSQVLFIHADIKAEALFLDLKGMHCAIIDFDGGALASSANDSPTTFGTPQDWLAPEIARQLTTPGRSGQIKVTLLSDVWAVNVAIHYILFGIPPFFFLSEVSDRSIDAFVKKYQWPHCDPSFTFFQKGMAADHKSFVTYLEKAIHPEIVKKLRTTINTGYLNPALRITYGHWKTALSTLTRPDIRDFNADPRVVEDGRKVHLTWDTTAAAKIELTNVGDVTHRTSADVSVTADTQFDLVLTADDGTQQTRSIVVTTDKRPPEIAWFRTSNTLLTDATPARLSWQVERAARVQIDHGIGDVTLQGRTGQVDVLPRSNTVYSLTATSYFGVTATRTVEVRVSDTPPVISTFQADATCLEGGRPVTLNWAVSANAHEVTISGLGVVPKSGRRQVDQRRAARYVLTATTFFGKSISAVIDVGVSQAKPIIHEFTIRPTILRFGADVTMNWNVSGAERVWLEPEGRDLPMIGSETFRPTQITPFRIRATSWYGVQVERRIDVTVVRKTVLDKTSVTKLDRTRVTKLPTRR